LDPNYALAHADWPWPVQSCGFAFASEGEFKTWEEAPTRKPNEQVELDMTWRKRTKPWQQFIRHAEFDWCVCSSRVGALWNSIQTSICHTFTEQLPSITLGLMDEVETEVRAGEEVIPANRVEPLRIRGSTEFFSGRFENAERHWTELRNLSPGPVSDWYLAQAMYYVAIMGRRKPC